MISLVLIGLSLVIFSHFLTREDERSFIRDSGSGIIVFGVTRWLTQQGKKRFNPETRQPLRNSTLRFKLPPEN